MNMTEKMTGFCMGEYRNGCPGRHIIITTLVPIFLFSFELIGLYVDSWLISGSLGQVVCKLVPFLGVISMLVSIQSLVLMAVDRFGAVVFPLRSTLISSRICPFFILATWIVAMAFLSLYLFAFKLIEYPERRACEKR